MANGSDGPVKQKVVGIKELIRSFYRRFCAAQTPCDLPSVVAVVVIRPRLLDVHLRQLGGSVGVCLRARPDRKEGHRRELHFWQEQPEL